MTSRRQFIAGVLASGLVTTPGWADAGAPRYLTAARAPSGGYVLVGLTADLIEAFRLQLPTRGHAAAAHPQRPEAVAFARRPGTYAIVVDCRRGDVVAWLDSPPGRHFFGHGVFSAQGDRLFTTENDYENARGVIGVWDVRSGYQRIGEFESGGIGPHELALLPDVDMLVIANGGIETHPESGRAKLNIPMMRPNLTYCQLDGQIVETVEPEEDMRRNSIRHLGVGADGSVCFGMQWQGGKHDVVPLVGMHRRGSGLALFPADTAFWRQMNGYVGSVAVSQDGKQAAVTSPRGNFAAVFDVASGVPSEVVSLDDVCGIAAAEAGFVVTTGSGSVKTLSHTVHSSLDLSFDNHLVGL